MKRMIWVIFSTLAAASLLMFLLMTAALGFAAFIAIRHGRDHVDVPPEAFIQTGLSAILPGLWAFIIVRIRLAQRRTRHRAANRLCIRCGYDLRATPHKCPECGKEVTEWVTTKSIKPRTCG